MYAASNKLFAFDEFKVQLMQSPLLSAAPEFWAISVPVAEVILSGLLFFRCRSSCEHTIYSQLIRSPLPRLLTGNI
jgi:hypothetical protein